MNDNDRPLDQAPAADPALDALRDIEEGAEYASGPVPAALIATIRDALADRITAEEARIAEDWGIRITFEPDSAERALIARLGKIAEAGL